MLYIRFGVFWTHMQVYILLCIPFCPYIYPLATVDGRERDRWAASVVAGASSSTSPDASTGWHWWRLRRGWTRAGRRRSSEAPTRPEVGTRDQQLAGWSATVGAATVVEEAATEEAGCLLRCAGSFGTERGWQAKGKIGHMKVSTSVCRYA